MRTNFSTPIPSSFAVNPHHTAGFCSSSSSQGRSSTFRDFLLVEFVTGSPLIISRRFGGRIRHVSCIPPSQNIFGGRIYHRDAAHPHRTFLLVEFVTGSPLIISRLFGGRIRHCAASHHPRTFLLVEFITGTQLTIPEHFCWWSSSQGCSSPL